MTAEGECFRPFSPTTSRFGRLRKILMMSFGVSLSGKTLRYIPSSLPRNNGNLFCSWVSIAGLKRFLTSVQTLTVVREGLGRGWIRYGAEPLKQHNYHVWIFKAPFTLTVMLRQRGSFMLK